MIYDLIIIGGGPAGVAAGVYSARKQLKTALITKSFGGQSIDSLGIENWIGDIKISGIDLANKLENHVRAYAGEFVDIKKNEWVLEIKQIEKNKFEIKTDKNSYLSKTVLIASGSSRKKILAKNADLFEHKGLTYCASCDGPFFKDKIVAVVGGGNSALEAVMQLLAYTKKVFLIHRRNEFRADPVTVENIKKDSKLEIIYNSEIVEILGNNFVTGLKYKDKNTNNETEIYVDGIFVEIGSNPASDCVKNLINLTEDGHIITDRTNQRTSVEGIWSAGDVTDVKYHQNNIAVGDAVLALEDIYSYIKSNQ
ncbi:MAG TPA: FAD-dependent oxidoreductase [Candidatus Paceibacterota bacterium]|nr:FAD-dependent oxidoreductase [Candidatus Paceibacterota bacterium]HMP18845.1 FAD-dependent oxidoreductase [Candidatus Paceibacterota bacterium]HMP85363.1 FAD-dependent oxidoreductase [Candidatus Paceibacterota bacterium]